MPQVQAYAATSPSSPLAPFTFERRTPGALDVALDILYCGVCHSDLHTARNEWHNTLYPSVPGHEIVGRVSQVGELVTRFKVGDLVGVGCMVDSCQHCQPCADGLEQYCDNGFTGTYNGPEQGTGANTFGGYSSHLVVRESFVLRISHPEAELAGVAPLAVRRHHQLFTATPVAGRARPQGRHRRPGRTRPHGREDCRRHGRACGAVHHQRRQAR